MKNMLDRFRRGRITSWATAVPPLAFSQNELGEFLAAHYQDQLTPRNMRLLHQFFEHPSVRTRHLAISCFEEAILEDPDSRAARFTRWGIDLGVEAARLSMQRSGLAAADVRGLVVNTCTGYICPGLSTYIAQRLGLRSDVRTYDLLGLGCGGVVPNINLCCDMVDAEGGAVVGVAVEICSATFEMGNELSLIISNALFGDGAAAWTVCDSKTGLLPVSFAGSLDQERREDVRFVHRQGRLHNQVSASLPALLRQMIPPVITRALSSSHLALDDIRHWLIHPGGEKIINEIQTELALNDAAVQPARQILKTHGNMSSPTVMFELEQVASESGIEGPACIVAAGAGMSAYCCVLTS